MPYRCSLRHISTLRLAACAGRLKTRSSHGAAESVGTCIATMLYVYHYKDKTKSMIARRNRCREGLNNKCDSQAWKIRRWICNRLLSPSGGFHQSVRGRFPRTVSSQFFCFYVPLPLPTQDVPRRPTRIRPKRFLRNPRHPRPYMCVATLERMERMLHHTTGALQARRFVG